MPRFVHVSLVRSLAPGVALCAAVTVGAILLAQAERALTGQAYVEALVMAILLGTAVRTAWTPGPRWRPGIGFSGKLLLEIAVALLGAAVSPRAVAAAGPWLLAGIAGVVTLSLLIAYAIGRIFGLTSRMAVLVACGNSICGNSAIAAVAPAIDAHPEDVAGAIAFTAVLGVAVVLGLPLLMVALGMSSYAYGVLAGLMVYAVPQVLAATAPVGALAMQIGTLVKLVRVLMLGPVVLAVSIAFGSKGGQRLQWSRMVPWFITGFAALAALRAMGLVPDMAQQVMAVLASAFTVIAMAALGLGVDMRVIGKVGGRAIATVTLSLLLLLGLSLGLIHILAIA